MAVDSFLGKYGAGEFAESREYIGEIDEIFAGAAGLDVTGPPHKQRDVSTSICHAALSSGDFLVVAPGVHKIAVGAVVSHEKDDGVFGDTEVVQCFKDDSDLLVEIGDHVREVFGVAFVSLAW